MEREKLIDKLALAICREKCAFYGDPPCFELTSDEDDTLFPWPNPYCDEPGCMSLAAAALTAIEAEG